MKKICSLFISVFAVISSCGSLSSYPISDRQDFYRSHCRIAYSGSLSYNISLSHSPKSRLGLASDDSHQNHFHHNSGPLSYLLSNHRSFVKRTPIEEKSVYIGVYIPDAKMELARPYLPSESFGKDYFSLDEKRIDFKYVCALSKYEYHRAYEDEDYERSYNGFDDVLFLSYDDTSKMPVRLDQYNLCGVIKETKAKLENFYGGTDGEDYVYTLLEGDNQNGTLINVESIDGKHCFANRDDCISGLYGEPNVYLSYSTRMSFVEMLFEPHHWLGSYVDLATYGRVDDQYLYYPIVGAKQGDISLSDDEFYYISGGCLEEETRAAIVEILNVVDPVHSAFDYTNYMKVAKIDYKKLLSAVE